MVRTDCRPAEVQSAEPTTVATEVPFLFDKSAPSPNGTSDAAPQLKRTRTAAKKTISDLRWPEAVLAVKESVECGILRNCKLA